MPIDVFIDRLRLTFKIVYARVQKKGKHAPEIGKLRLEMSKQLRAKTNRISQLEKQIAQLEEKNIQLKALQNEKIAFANVEYETRIREECSEKIDKIDEEWYLGSKYHNCTLEIPNEEAIINGIVSLEQNIIFSRAAHAGNVQQQLTQADIHAQNVRKLERQLQTARKAIEKKDSPTSDQQTIWNLRRQALRAADVSGTLLYSRLLNTSTYELIRTHLKDIKKKSRGD